MSDLISRLREGGEIIRTAKIADKLLIDLRDLVNECADALEAKDTRIAELEAERDAANSRIELLESDMKSGDYESLYGQAVRQLSDATEAQQVLGLKLAQVEAEREAENAKLRVDAGRYRFLRHHTQGLRSPAAGLWFEIPTIRPVGNIMQGSVAQHLDEAIDAAIKEQQ